ncbi:MAG: hypothetical protein OXI22_19400 [Defluviicoccus sp.]|nr:hypothetical protein [Defluviicoccus sp.]MDE0386054.1 hypothetical protein [Defluviicoccus sp.]
MKRTKKDILAEVKALAVEYHELTGKPLGVTGEIGEFEAAEIMGLTVPGSKARNERGQMGVPQFKAIAEKVWPD